QAHITDDAGHTLGGPIAALDLNKRRQRRVIHEAVGAVFAAEVAEEADAVTTLFQRDGGNRTLLLGGRQTHSCGAGLFQHTDLNTLFATDNRAASKVGIPRSQRNVGEIAVFVGRPGRLDDALDNLLVFRRTER